MRLLGMRDYDGVIPSHVCRDLFERGVKNSPSLEKKVDLREVIVDGNFTGFVRDDTQNMFVGFSLGLRCAERLEKAKESPLLKRIEELEKELETFRSPNRLYAPPDCSRECSWLESVHGTECPQGGCIGIRKSVSAD